MPAGPLECPDCHCANDLHRTISYASRGKRWIAGVLCLHCNRWCLVDSNRKHELELLTVETGITIQ